VGAVRARRVERLGALVLRERPGTADPGAVADAAPRRRARRGARTAARRRLPWSVRRARACASASPSSGARRAPARRRAATGGPTGPTRARRRARRLAGPSLHGMRGGPTSTRFDLAAVLAARLTWAQRAALDGLAPTHVTVPTGSRVRGRLRRPRRPGARRAPAGAVRRSGHATRCGGRVALTLHLLSPAHVRCRSPATSRASGGRATSTCGATCAAATRGTPWPDDPLAATPTRRAKPRG
jgi:ATP-dependent helicase HrpB